MVLRSENPNCFTCSNKISNIRTSKTFFLKVQSDVLRLEPNRPKELKRTKMLFGHRWVDKTRPHNLLADWSQEEEKKKKKSNTFTEKWMKKKNKNKNRQHTWEQKYVCINWCVTMSHFCTVANPFQTSTWVHKDAVK